MLHIGLTGGIGSGKSTATRVLADLGAVVIDSDLIAREVLEPGTDGLAEVAALFGDGVVDAQGRLDRAALAAIVFGDASARRDLEAITHPRIAERTGERLRAAPPDAVVVHDVPLLVEKAMGALYHLVVVIDVPAQVRLARLVEGRGMSAADARARIEHQVDDDQRRHAADVLLPNVDAPDQLEQSVRRLWEERLRPFEENVRLGRRVRRPEQPVLATYDPRWPDEAARLAARLSRALGDRAPEIEHVGSTSVAGLVAKDVIDLQIGVGDLRSADDPEFVEAMAALGFPRSEGNSLDHVKEGLPDPSAWVKRFHGSCDPGRITHVHVRELGGAGWQYALLFRDWLRADSAAREDYAAHKRDLVAACTSTTQYSEAKEPWFTANWPRMQEWARRTGWHD